MGGCLADERRAHSPELGGCGRTERANPHARGPFSSPPRDRRRAGGRCGTRKSGGESWFARGRHHLRVQGPTGGKYRPISTLPGGGRNWSDLTAHGLASHRETGIARHAGRMATERPAELNTVSIMELELLEPPGRVAPIPDVIEPTWTAEHR